MAVGGCIFTAGVGAAVFSHDLLFLADGGEKCAGVINGRDYLLGKCGFLAQQPHFHDLNPGRDASSSRPSSTPPKPPNPTLVTAAEKKVVKWFQSGDG